MFVWEFSWSSRRLEEQIALLVDAKRKAAYMLQVRAAESPYQPLIVVQYLQPHDQLMT
jgi:hypothetical protein